MPRKKLFRKLWMRNKLRKMRNNVKKTKLKDKKNRKKRTKTLNMNKQKILEVAVPQPKNIWALQREQLLKWLKTNK